MTLFVSAEGRRSFVAAENIPANTVVYEDTPLLTACNDDVTSYRQDVAMYDDVASEGGKRIQFSKPLPMQILSLKVARALNGEDKLLKYKLRTLQNSIKMMSAEEIERFRGRKALALAYSIIATNSFDVIPNDGATAALYFGASFFNHSCRPNCSKKFSNEGVITVTSSVAIEKGTEITINYFFGGNPTIENLANSFQKNFGEPCQCGNHNF